MKFIVGLCGTHGTGKSTILHSVKNAGYPVNESQLSRSAQKSLGWDSLKRAQESIDNMWALQNAILAQCLIRDSEIDNSRNITLVERTPADFWAYTEMWCKRLNIDIKKDERAMTYYDQCVDMSKRYSRFINVPMIDEIPFVEDPHRADLESRVFVDGAINKFLDNLDGVTKLKIYGNNRVLRGNQVIMAMHAAREVYIGNYDVGDYE